MKICKKLLSVMLIITLVLSALICVPFSANAATLVWPVYGHKALSRDFWQHGGQAIDISDGSIDGATVRAAMGGTVTSITLCPLNHYYESNPMPSCCLGGGFSLVIHGDDGRYYNYGHMQAYSIPTDRVYYGARVETGQEIGKVGNTGNSSGPHLHFLISTSSRWWESGFVNPQTETYVDFVDQEEFIDYGNDFYAFIFNKASWKPIGQTDSGNVEVMDETRTNMDRLIWHFTKNSDGKSYRIQSLLNGKYLDASNSGDSNGTNILCWESNGASNQNWYFSRKGGFDAMRPAYTDKVVDMNGGNSSAGTNIQLWERNGTNAQNFVPFNLLNEDLKLNYTITADKTEMGSNEEAKVSVAGAVTYVYNYKFHIIDPLGTEKVVDNKCNPTFVFKPDTQGVYTIFAEIKNISYSEIGSKTNKAVTIKVGCGHEYNDKFIEAGNGETKGYILHTCSKCGNTYKDNYMEKKDGWYYSDNLPNVVSSSNYTIEYNNYYSKTQKDSPGSDWKNEGVVKNEWQNTGSQYTTYIPLETSDSRVLVSEYYYHWCIPGAGLGSEGNYEQNSKFTHYDQISLPNDSINVTWSGDDNGHPVYTLAWPNGAAVACKSGEQCDGSFGYHDYRCKAWYKNYVYQDRVKVELYKYTKNSGWTDSADSLATKTTYRFKTGASDSDGMLGDVNLDGSVTIKDATIIQKHIAYLVQMDNTQIKNADTNSDGRISIDDVTTIQRFVAGILPSLGK